MPTNTRNLGRKVLRVDIFGETVGFSIDGSNSRRSILGALLSLAIFATVMTYATKKFGVMINRDDTQI